MTSMQQISELIREKIESQEMSVAQLAALVGCSRQYVYDLIDANRPKPRQLTMQMAERFASACGFTVTVNRNERKKRGSKAG